jgi:hypothetical protein
MITICLPRSGDERLEISKDVSRDLRYSDGSIPSRMARAMPERGSEGHRANMELVNGLDDFL